MYLNDLFLLSLWNSHQSGDDSDDEDSSDDEHYFEEDLDLPNTYRDIKVHLKSLRLDAVLAAGLNVARK